MVTRRQWLAQQMPWGLAAVGAAGWLPSAAHALPARTLVDRMVDVADCESIAAMRALSQLLGRRVGPSTGTNFVAMLTLASEMRERGERGSILSLLCDAGERYLPTYFDTAWVDRTFGDCSAAQQKIDALIG